MTRNKYPLTTQTTHLFIVIRKNKVISKDLIKAYCDEFFEQYAFIEHKEDKEPVSQLIEGVHYHIVGYAKKKKTRLSTHLEDLTKYFRFDDSNGIQIDKFDNVVSAIQYLIHKNNPEKTQHKFSEVIYKWDNEEIALIMNAEQSEVISFDMVYSCCIRAKNIVQVIQTLGFKTYARYRTTILDMYNEIQQARCR